AGARPRTGARRPASRARDWRLVHSANRAPESLLLLAASAAVRLRHSHRRDAGARAARTKRGLGGGRDGGDVSHGAVEGLRAMATIHVPAGDVRLAGDLTV